MKPVIFFTLITFSYTKCFVHSYTVDVVFSLSYWGYLLNTRKWLPAALHGPSVWQSLPGRFPADDILFELIVNFLALELLTSFNKSSPGDFWSYLCPLRVATTGTSPSWVIRLNYMYMNERVGRKLNRHIILHYQVTLLHGFLWPPFITVTSKWAR